MSKPRTVQVTADAYDIILRHAKHAEKSITIAASELVQVGKNEIDLERQKLRNEIAEMREEMRKFATRKDIAAIFYTLARIGEKGLKKERASLGYRMQLGHDVSCDFSVIKFDEND